MEADKNDERHSAVDECLSRIAAAWGAGGAPAFAAEFTEDASYVIFAGIVSLGRAEIEKAHVPVFEKWQKGSRMSMRELHRRVSGDSVNRTPVKALTRDGVSTSYPSRSAPP